MAIWTRQIEGLRIKNQALLGGAQFDTSLAFWTKPIRTTGRETVLRVPYWLVAVILTLYPFYVLVIARAIRRRRERVRGLCIRCRYDLTGNVSGVCPECGERTPRTIERAPT